MLSLRFPPSHVSTVRMGAHEAQALGNVRVRHQRTLRRAAQLIHGEPFLLRWKDGDPERPSNLSKVTQKVPCACHARKALLPTAGTTAHHPSLPHGTPSADTPLDPGPERLLPSDQEALQAGTLRHLELPASWAPGNRLLSSSLLTLSCFRVSHRQHLARPLAMAFHQQGQVLHAPSANSERVGLSLTISPCTPPSV